VLAAQAGTELFTPASNAKLYTTALALVRLGATYQFRTVVRTSMPVSPGESAVSDLIFVGGGDPNLSGRVLPFSQTAIDSNPLSSVQKLADQIQSRGIETVKGDIVGDDTRYPFEPYPDGWTVDDSLWYYGAPVSALAVNDNAMRITVRPSNSGELASARMEPDFGYFLLMNQAVTDESRASHIQISRNPGSNEIVISGSIGKLAPPLQEELGVPDAALFAAEALKSELESRGIAILGEARGLHRDLSAVPDPLRAPRLVDLPAGTEVASIDSAPVWQTIQVINKVSQNLHAEMLLREVAVATRGVGTLAAGLDERKIFLLSAGIPENSYELDDGSGLARQDLTSPHATVQLLRYMWNRPERETWVASLPVWGADGNLQHHFKAIEGAARVHAKTGSLAHVAALSGYLQTDSGRWIAFSLMANSEIDKTGAVQKLFDAACALFLQQ
jgi:D-alanyl-D-alanine carboxypeptidase/D-alanyl-D-alanine-endopeptidase (penicillin-binding protein 4)